MNQNGDKRDDFWDIASLLPSKKPIYRERGGASTDTVEVRQSSGQPSPSSDAPLTVRYVNREPLERPEPDERYCPKNSLIQEVRIYHRRDEQGYYEQFAKQAIELCGRKGSACDAVDFFSYMPQYSQMTREQLSYYLWWRTSLEKGEAPDAAASYLLLYLYEQICLAEHLSPITVRKNMLKLWGCYGKKHPRIAALAREWICDLSLLYRLPPPRFSPALYRELLSGFRLKEYYVPAEPDLDLLSSAVLLFCNNYDYTKSRYCEKAVRADFDRVLGGAVRVALDFLREQGNGLLTGQNGISTVSRDCFAGAICPCRLKCRVEVDYTSFSSTHELRYIISDVLKYAENALRGAIGVRSRLTVYSVSAALRTRLDVYLGSALPEKKRRQEKPQKVEIPDYERRYDLAAAPISLAHAADIEASSWQTTKRLIEAFMPDNGIENAPISHEGDMGVEPDLAQEGPAESAKEGAEDKTEGCRWDALGDLLEFLRAAARTDSAAQRELARKMGEMPDAIADKINTVSGDIIGDIILEDRGGVYAVIEDYFELLKEEGVL